MQLFVKFLAFPGCCKLGALYPREAIHVQIENGNKDDCSGQDGVRKRFGC